MSVAPPSPSSTIVLLRAAAAGAPEVLLLERHARASSFAGNRVFPGGRVDDGDREPAWEELSLGQPALREAWPQADASWLRDHAVAAVRELFEETGVLLADTVVDVKEGRPVIRQGHGRTSEERRQLLDGLASFASLCERRKWRIRLDRLVPFVRWITPESERRRFDTVFFAGEVGSATAEMHEQEMADHAWWTASNAVSKFDRGEVALAPPTLRTLEHLARFATLEATIQWARAVPRQVIEPRLVEDESGKRLVLPGDPLYPPSEGPGTPVEGPTRFVFDGGRWRSAV
jgi:8-oxo-dGTP pyrophosphatase MutT (NUDIX family)